LIARLACTSVILEGVDDVIEALIPDDWLRSEFVKQLSDEDKAKDRVAGRT